MKEGGRNKKTNGLGREIDEKREEGRAAGIPRTTRERKNSCQRGKIIYIYDKCYEGVGNNVILFQ